eukprot:gene1936-1968_t
MPTQIAIPTINLATIAETCPGLIGDIRSDHAGETGAVMIYRGILAGSKNPAIRSFAEAHMATEQGHLDLLNTLLPASQRSALLPIWRVAGWLTGFLPAIAGSRATYATIDAVETFVDHHYEEQIKKLAPTGPEGELRTALLICQADEVHHRDEAREHQTTRAGWLLTAWMWAADMTAPAPLQVYYDGGCPVCSREIAFYKTRPGTNGFRWIDVNAASPADLGPGLTRDLALARMHAAERRRRFRRDVARDARL